MTGCAGAVCGGNGNKGHGVNAACAGLSHHTWGAALRLCPPLHASHPRLFHSSIPFDSRPPAEAGRASTMAALSELAGSAGAAPPAQPAAGQWSAWQSVHSAASGWAPAAPEETDPFAELVPPELAAGGGIAAAASPACQQVPGAARSLSDSLSSQPRPGSGLGGSGMLFGPGSCFSTGSSSVHSGGALVAPGAAEAYAAQTPPPPPAATSADGARAAVESAAAAAMDMEETETEGAGVESPSMAEVPILHEEGSGEWGGSGAAAGPTVGDGSLPAAAADGSEGMDSSEEWEVVQEAGDEQEEEEGAGGGEEEVEERGMPAPA